MQQLLLNLLNKAPPSFANFVSTGNEELLHHLSNISSHLYLWGDAGCGRTHLLRATAAHRRAQGHQAVYITASAPVLHTDASDILYAIDDVEKLSTEAQTQLFNDFNHSREQRITLLLSGSAPPLSLKLREDLRTRIGQCLLYQVQPLNDLTRDNILHTLAERHHLHLPPEVAHYILTHASRDIRELAGLIAALDQLSLTTQRPITIPLVRELIMRQTAEGN